MQLCSKIFQHLGHLFPLALLTSTIVFSCSDNIFSALDVIKYSAKSKLFNNSYFIILESLLKWFAPILVFTTDEIYSLISKEEKNIHEFSFVEVPKNWENLKLNDKWDQLFKIKQEANIAIEAKRTSKEI